MPLGSWPYYEEEDPYEPPPTNPPPTGSGDGGPGGDVRVVPDPGAPVPPPEVPGSGGGFGGGGGFSGMPPGYPNFNIPGAPIFTPPQWRAPTMDDARNEPGFQFRLKSGADAMERSAAAKGLLRTGGTLTNLQEYGQNFGAQEYGNVYNRALGAYDREYRGASDAFAPKYAQWQLGASGSRDAQLARYQSQLSQWLQSQQPRPEPQLPPLDPPPTHPDDVSGYSGGDPWTDNYGDPWTDRETPYY